MRKAAIAIFLLILLALDWAALHDIIQGEVTVGMEWAFVIGSVLLLLAYASRKSVN
jgi:hypothetical protein